MKGYKRIYGDMKETYDCAHGGCCCTMLVPLLIALIFAMFPEEFGDPLFFSKIDVPIAIPFIYAFFGIIGYWIGYNSVVFRFPLEIDKPPMKEVEAICALSEIPGVTPRADVEIGFGKIPSIIYSTSWKIHIDDLPETVYILFGKKAEEHPVSTLIGYIENGPFVDERTIELPF